MGMKREAVQVSSIFVQNFVILFTYLKQSIL